MPVDLDDIFSRGGRELIDLLDYAVRAVKPDLLFVFLVQEYRLHPTTPKAVALYDIFCAPQAPARLSAAEMLPPASLQIDAAVRLARSNLAQVEAARAGASVAPPLILPPKFLFDAIALHLWKKSPSLRSIRRRYQPQRSPVKNLPGGRMNAGQRFFVDKVWEPNLRPRLVAVGFRRMSSIA
jgi:hypothetical protein